MKARNILLIGVILCVSLLVQLANREQAILHADISYGGGVPRTAIYFPYVIYSASPSFNTGLSIAGNTENIPPEETPQIWLYYYDEAGICYPCINNPIPVARGQNSQWTASMDMLSFVNLNKPPNGTLLALTNIPNAKPAACFFDMQTGVLSDITPIVDYSIIGVAQNGRIVRRPEYTPPRNLENPDDPTNFFNLAENQTSIDPALHHTTLFFPMCIHDLGYDTAFTITNSYDASGIGNRSASLYIYNKSGDLSRKIVVDMDSSGKAVSPSIIGVFSDLARTDISVLRNRAGIDSCEQYVPFSGQGWMMAVVNIPYAYGWSFIIRAGFVQGNATYPPTVDNNVWGVDSNWTPQRLVPSISDHTSIVVPFVPITQNFSTVVFFANTEKTASAAIHFSLYGMAGNLRKQWDYPTSGSLPCGNAATQSGFVYITNTGILVEEQPYDLPDVTDGWLLITIDSPNAYAVEFLAQVDAQHNYLCATNCIVDNNILGARPDGKIDRLIPLSPSAGNRFDVPLVLQGNPLPTFTATATANTCNQDDLISAGVTAVTYKYQGWTMPPAQTCYTTNPSPVSLNLTLATPRPPLAPSHFQVWDFMPGWGSGEEETSTQGTYQLRFHVLYVGSTVVDNMCASTADGYLMRGFRLDLDIDSDNDNGYDPPGRTVVEENIEGNAPGKVLVINDRDQDGDDVPDYADGFNLNGSEGDVDADDMNAQEKFVPLVLELPPGIDLDRILILFYYDASDPAGVNQEDYTPAPGALRVWEKDGNVARNKNAINAAQEQNRGDYVPPGVYPPAQLGFGEQGGTITLYVEGIAPITEHPFIYTMLYVMGEDIRPEEWVRVSTVSPYDIDIDSDNNNGYDMPERSWAEEEVEAVAPGKFIGVNYQDGDGDGVPGFADGFNRDGQAGNDDDITTGEEFTPLIIELPHSVNPNATIWFLYVASDPAGVTREGTSPNYTYAPAPGKMRIWTKDADQPRNKKSVGEGGDYVPAFPFGVSLDFDKGKVELFVEGIAPSSSTGGNSISAMIDPDGEGPEEIILIDFVLVTAVKVDLIAKDVEEKDEERRGSVVCLNNDNDDFDFNPASLNYQPDREQTGKVEQEDDLREIQIQVLPSDLNVGELWLEISQGAPGPGANDTKIKVWEKATKETVVLDGQNKIKKWNTNALDFTHDIKFYVEGYNGSDTVKDVTLKLAFHPNPAADVPVEDSVNYTVVQLMLDVDSDNAATDDNQCFRPGYDTVNAAEGNPVITGPNWRQQMQLIVSPMSIAAPANSDGTELATVTEFRLEDTTNYRGIAMNFGINTLTDYAFDPELSLSFSAKDTTIGTQVRQPFYCKDYGGATRVLVDIKRGSTVLATCELRVPLDTDRDELPDFYEQEGPNDYDYGDDPVRQALAGGGAVQVFDPKDPQTKAVAAVGATPAQAPMASRLWEYEDQNPQAAAVPANGKTGDGLIAFEEYRGFVCEAVHHRTSPHYKDVFAYSSVTDVDVPRTDMGLGCLPTAIGDTLRVHRIRFDEWDPETRVINFNRNDIAGATSQCAMKVAAAALGGAGETSFMVTTGENGVCSTTANAASDDVQSIPVDEGLPNQTAIEPGPNGFIDPHVEVGDKIDWALLRIVSNTPDGHLHTLKLPTKTDKSAWGYDPDDRIRGNVQGQNGKLTHATVTGMDANDVLRGTIRPAAGNTLQDATVQNMNVNDVMRGTIRPAAGNALQDATVQNMNANDVLRGNIHPAAGNDLQDATVQNMNANDVLRGTIHPAAGNDLQDATVRNMNANDVLRGTIVEGADNKLEQATVTSGGGNDDHSLLRIEAGPDATLDTPCHANDVTENDMILPGVDNILDSAANLANDDVIRGTIQEGADNKLDSRPANANDLVEGHIKEGADNKLDSKPANANDVVEGGIEEGADGHLDSMPANANDVVDGHIEEGADNKLDSKPANANDVVEGQIEEGVDNKLDSKPANANDTVNGTIEEGADAKLDSRPAAGSTDFVIGYVEDGGNGYLDPTTNNAAATVAQSVPAKLAAKDDTYDTIVRRIRTGPDGIRNTDPQTGGDDFAVISAAGCGKPHTKCIDPGVDGGLSTAPNAGSDDTGFSRDVNNANTCLVDARKFDILLGMWQRVLVGVPPAPDEYSHNALVDCRLASGAPAEVNRRILLNKTIGHELGHHMGMAGDYVNVFTPFVPPPPHVGTDSCAPADARRTVEGSVMMQTNQTIWSSLGVNTFPTEYDNIDKQEIRLHIKHP